MHRCVDRPEELTVGRARYLDLLSPEDSKMRPDLRGRSMRARNLEKDAADVTFLELPRIASWRFERDALAAAISDRVVKT